MLPNTSLILSLLLKLARLTTPLLKFGASSLIITKVILGLLAVSYTKQQCLNRHLEQKRLKNSSKR